MTLAHEALTSGAIAIQTPEGLITLRPERADDRAFRFELFCRSRLPEWDLVQIGPQLRAQLMQHQFLAQATSYAQAFPQARFDIIELAGEPIGRIVVDRPGDQVHIVDQAVSPAYRNRGIGTAIMRALMEEAGAAGTPVRLKVADANDPSLRLYLRLGFRPIASMPLYLELEWRADPSEQTEGLKAACGRQ